MPAFQALLATYVERFGGQTALAKAMEMSPSRINKVLKGEYSFDIANCLRLAAVTGDSATKILRAADKGDVAELIERLYGESRRPAETALSPADRALLDRWHRLTPHRRALLEGALNEFVGDEAAPKKRKSA